MDDGGQVGVERTAASALLSAPSAASAVVGLFAYNGLACGVYAASIPTLRARLGLEPIHITALLMVVGLFAIGGMQLSGRLSDRLGARRPALVGLPLLSLALLGIAFAGSYPALLAAGALFGLGNGTIDVSMNAIGVQVERHRPRPIMSFFHGMWSVGNFAGAALVFACGLTFGERPDLVVRAAAGTVAVVAVAAASFALRRTPETEPVRHVDASGTRTRIPTAAWLLGLMAIAFGLGEGVAMDWSALHLTDVARVTPAQGSLAVAAVAGCMVVIRLLGDGLVARYGRRAIVRFGGVCAAAGYFVVAFATPLPLLVLGWALAGLGIGMIAPQVYAVAGHAGGGRVLAVVVTFGYATFLVGPAVIGALVSWLGIQHAMIFPGVLLTGLLFLARLMPARSA